MRQVLSTDMLPAPQRFAFWRDLVSEMTMPIDVRSEHAGDFTATVESASLGAIEILRMRHKPIVVDRSQRLIRRSDPDVVHLVLSLAGHQRISQDRGEVVLRPGDMTLYSSSRVFRTYPDPTLDLESAVVLVLPRAVLAVPRLTEALTVRFDPEDPLCGLVSAHMQALARNPRFDPADAPRLSTMTVDLVSMMLARRLSTDNPLGPEARDRVLLARAQAFIDRFLGEPGLTPQAVAEAHHVSLRTLQRVFQAHDLTAGSWIRSRRLDRCRRDLADPQKHGVPIHTVAAQWAIPPGAHFSRAFKEAYGLSPQAYRDQQLRPPR
jgi:AraC-like DNA-binding protein